MATEYVALYRSLLARTSISARVAPAPTLAPILEEELNGKGPLGDHRSRAPQAPSLMISP
jgi:hypothetical protein